MIPLRQLMAELRQRHVFRVAGVYAAVGFVLLQVADLVVTPLRLPAWTMPMAILLVVLGFPIALVLSWALELTPEGIRRAPPSTLMADKPLRRRLAVLLLVGGTTALLGGIAIHLGRGAPDEALRSIAVLPFADMSLNRDQGYFSDGLAEELTAALSRVDGLRVAARTAAFQFREGGADPGEVGRRLQVGAILEGSVRRDADQLRVTVRLVDVSTGYELWTETYHRRMTDIFAVQADIAREVLNALRFPPMNATFRTGTLNAAAYDHLLRGNHHLARRTPDDTRRAIAEYEAATLADRTAATPLFRQAYAALIHVDWGWIHPDMTMDALLDRAAALIDRGLEMEPRSAEGWLARAYLNAMADPFAMRGAVEAFEQSLALDARSAEAWHQYGQTLMVLGRLDDAMAAYHRVLRTEPQRSMTLVPMAAIALQRGDLDEALFWADSAVAIDPANSYARANRARAYLAAGHAARGLAEAEFAVSIDEGHAVTVSTTLAMALARTGEQDRAREVFDAALSAAGADSLSAVDAQFLAMAAAALGEVDAAIALLQRARPKGAWFLFYLQSPCSPTCGAMHASASSSAPPRFAAGAAELPAAADTPGTSR
jgi:adenylate cyclase